MGFGLSAIQSCFTLQMKTFFQSVDTFSECKSTLRITTCNYLSILHKLFSWPPHCWNKWIRKWSLKTCSAFVSISVPIGCAKISDHIFAGYQTRLLPSSVPALAEPSWTGLVLILSLPIISCSYSFHPPIHPGK